MRIRILTITHKVPTWIQEGYHEFKKRLQPYCTLDVIEIPAVKRTLNANMTDTVNREGEKMLKCINPQHVVIALEIKGKSLSTEELAAKIERWQQDAGGIDFMIGGPDGLSKACLSNARERLSLSPLTFPHALVRVILSEQLYRAFSILNNHPYHR